MEGRALMKKLNLLNFHFYARLAYSVSLFYLRAYERNIIRDSGNRQPASGDLVVAVSGTHARAVTQLKVFKVGNFNVYLDLLLLIFRNWLLLSFNPYQLQRIEKLENLRYDYFTDKRLKHNRPDITVVYKDTREWTIIDIAVQADWTKISTEPREWK